MMVLWEIVFMFYWWFVVIKVLFLMHVSGSCLMIVSCQSWCSRNLICLTVTSQQPSSPWFRSDEPLSRHCSSHDGWVFSQITTLLTKFPVQRQLIRPWQLSLFSWILQASSEMRKVVKSVCCLWQCDDIIIESVLVELSCSVGCIWWWPAGGVHHTPVTSLPPSSSSSWSSSSWHGSSWILSAQQQLGPSLALSVPKLRIPDCTELRDTEWKWRWQDSAGGEEWSGCGGAGLADIYALSRLSQPDLAWPGELVLLCPATTVCPSDTAR